jgi:hypothetical protein
MAERLEFAQGPIDIGQMAVLGDIIGINYLEWYSSTEFSKGLV